MNDYLLVSTAKNQRGEQVELRQEVGESNRYFIAINGVDELSRFEHLRDAAFVFALGGCDARELI